MRFVASLDNEGACRYAISNTRRGIESCGILAGLLDEKNSCFQITTLIIPKQEGTSDTVQVLSHEASVPVMSFQMGRLVGIIPKSG